MEPILASKRYQEDGQSYRIKVIGGLHFMKGNRAPHFTLTADIDRQTGNRSWVEDSGGCQHETILKHFPQFKDLAALHLSDIDGVPIHSIENGWYWAGGTQWNRGRDGDPPDIKILASHLRIAEEKSRDLIVAVRDGLLDKPNFTAFCNEQIPRWNREARACVHTHKLGVFGEPWTPKAEENTDA